MSEASPVETVTTPGPPATTDRPRRRQPATSSAASSSSSRSAQRMTPAASSAASVTRSSPASEPLWATAAAWAWAAPPDLDREDRLAELERPVRQGEEPLGTLEALDEQDDRVGLRVVERVGEVVADVEDDLGAAPDDPAEADPRPRVDERIGDAPALGDSGHATARQPRVDVADVERRVRRQVDHAHAVRTDHREPVAEGDGPDVALHPGGRLASLDDATARDEDRLRPDVRSLLDDRRRTQRVEGHEDGVRHLGQGGQVRVAGLAPGDLVLRVDEVAAGGAAHDREVVADGPGEVRSGRRADDRDRARREQRSQVDLGPDAGTGLHAGGHDRFGGRRRVGRVDHPWPTTRSTPRFSRARAMISRWISLVPSQIRSTRSSRKKRSAANSRM